MVGPRAVLALFIVVFLSPWMGGTSRAQAAVSKEYQVKAAFVFRFMQFVEWPKGSFGASDGSVCIGVLGDDPFGPALDDVVRNESLQNRKLVVRRSSKVGDLRGCPVVFVSKSEKDRAPAILSSLGDASVLTVSEVENFGRLGGIINFYLEGQKVRFEINPISARKHGLKISSELLRLGKIVE